MEWCVILFIMAVAIVAGCPLAACCADGPANLVANGDFEADTDGDGFPDGWTLSVGSRHRGKRPGQ